jgi:hypothetical protein
MYVQIDRNTGPYGVWWGVWLVDPDRHDGKAPWLLSTFKTEDEAEAYLVKLFSLEIRRLSDVK